MGLLLVAHAALAMWGAACNSVTFDENFHLPAGVLIVAHHDFGGSIAQPPLTKTLCALAAMAAGARAPAGRSVDLKGERGVGEAFMRLNAAHYHRVFFAARCVVVLLSIGLGLLVWRWARRLYGAGGGLLALATYAFAPEALAHAGLVGMDLPTALTTLATLYCFWMFCRTGRWGWWVANALALAAAFLVRFTAVQLLPTLALLTALAGITHRLRRPRRVVLGLALLIPVVWLALNTGYLWQTSLFPFARRDFYSPLLQALHRGLAGFPLPLPDAYLVGMDYVSYLSQKLSPPTYLLGRIRSGPVPEYFPLALLFKWSLGFWALMVLRAIRAVFRGAIRRRPWDEAFVLLPVALLLGSAMFLAQLNVGVRYLFPLVPLLCVWNGGLAARNRPPRRARRRALWPVAACALVLVQMVETVSAAPWYLSFYNRLAGGPGGGYRLVNDSNVDWGQGLLALRDEMRRLGIKRINLAYHGTTDPAIYGIDYIPYLGGRPDSTSDWLAVSSYFFVGLGQRMMTQRGSTDRVQIDFRGLWNTPPVSTPAGCMFLFRLRTRAN